MNKYDWIDLKNEIIYWVTGSQDSRWFPYTSIKDRLNELKEVLWRLKRRLFLCPIGKHYLKMDAGGCILCKKKGF